MLAPEVSAQILSIRPEITRFIGARRRRKRLQSADLEDEVQEALTEIMRSAPKYRVELGEFRPWAFGIALNVQRRFARNRVRQRGCFSEQDVNADDHETHEPSPERWFQIHEARRHIECAHHDMPEAQYVALYLHVFEGQSHAEIATELGITKDASKQLVYRARAYLAERGLDEKTFFSALPVFVEFRARAGNASAFWRGAYDWCFRLGHGAALFIAVALMLPVKPRTAARASLDGFVREHAVVLEQPAAVPDKPTFFPDEPAPRVEKSPRIVAPVVRGVSSPRHRNTAPSSKSTFQAKPYDLSLMVRRNP